MANRLLEHGIEVAVAGEAECQCQIGDVVVVVQRFRARVVGVETVERTRLPRVSVVQALGLSTGISSREVAWMVLRVVVPTGGWR
jgi:hypothetical protein